MSLADLVLCNRSRLDRMYIAGQRKLTEYFIQQLKLPECLSFISIFATCLKAPKILIPMPRRRLSVKIPTEDFLTTCKVKGGTTFGIKYRTSPQGL